MCEAGLRLLGISYPDFYDYDPFLGSKLRPGIKGYFLKEGAAYVSINFRRPQGPGARPRPPPNTLRIPDPGKFLRRSHAGQPCRDLLGHHGERLAGLPQSGGLRVEVTNFGQAGFSMPQELLALRLRAWKYAADVVLLALFTDDIRRNLPEFMQYDFNPYFSLEAAAWSCRPPHPETVAPEALKTS